MAERLERIRLARAAAGLNRGCRTGLPALVLLTDDERLPDPVAAARALPRGSLVIVRARQAAHRARLARALRPLARARGLVLLIAGDSGLADRSGAAGLHLSEAGLREAAQLRARRPRWLITAAAHSLAACAAAKRAGADAVLLSPVFPTASHPGRAVLGSLRALTIARLSPLPVYALGGIEARTARRLTDSAFTGLAAIGALGA
jgi:thiamine-phosphate pyrophosphorylase